MNGPAMSADIEYIISLVMKHYLFPSGCLHNLCFVIFIREFPGGANANENLHGDYLNWQKQGQSYWSQWDRRREIKESLTYM